MGASRPDATAGRASLRLLWALAPAALCASPVASSAQVEAAPVLRGTLYVADTAAGEGTVVLHHVSDVGQGELDSTTVSDDGVFAFRLPGVPDPARSDVFFASVRHNGVLYFGPAVTRPMDLDSVYEIRAYDTLLAPVEGVPVAVQSRSVFLEPDSAGVWRVTDIFELRNDADRTIVVRSGGRTWGYPLPAEAREVVAGEGELSLDQSSFEEGELVVKAALPPGERLFVARYLLDSPFVSFPTPGTTETLDVFVREPVPALDVEGLDAMDRIEIEAGSTYRRYTGADFQGAFVRLVETEERGPPPVQWIAVTMALVLALGGLAAMRSGRRVARARPVSRQAVLMEVARLDEDFEARPSPSEKERRAYRRRREELMGRLRPGS